MKSLTQFIWWTASGRLFESAAGLRLRQLMMFKGLLLAVSLMLFVQSNATAALLVLWDTPITLWHNDTDGTEFATSSGNFSAFHTRSTPVTGRSFVELALANWYALGLGTGSIHSVTFEASFIQTNSLPTTGIAADVNLYAMLADEDGSIPFSQFNTAVSQIGGTITSNSYLSGLSMDVTPFVVADLLAGNSHSGFSIRLADEMMGNADEYRNVRFVAPRITIDYTPVPEPSTYSAILGVMALIAAGRRWRK